MDGKDAELAEFPGLTERELKAAENLFADYIFYHTEGRGRRVWTSCCHKAGIYLAAGVGAADPVRGVLASRHNEMVCCPFCGRWATLKCIGRIGRGALLEEYQPVVFLRASEDGQTLWAQGYWARKLYDKDDTDTLSAEPRYMATEVYRFRPGEAVRWGNNYHGWERVEKEFGGKWEEETYTTVSGRCRVIHSKKYTCSVCGKANGRAKTNFCHHCGASQTDEAVQMVMERLEALHDNRT